MQVVSPPPYINYVLTCSILASTDDLVGDLVHHLQGELDSDISIGYFETIQRIFFPSDEKLLETMAS